MSISTKGLYKNQVMMIGTSQFRLGPNLQGKGFCKRSILRFLLL